MYPAGAASEQDRSQMLKSMYLGVMGFSTVNTGNTSHLRPTCVTEIFEPEVDSGIPRKTDASDRKFDGEFEGKSEAVLDGFGFNFVREGLDNKIHNARVAIIDFSTWKLKHYLHFLSKLTQLFIFYNISNLTSLSPFENVPFFMKNRDWLISYQLNLFQFRCSCLGIE